MSEDIGHSNNPRNSKALAGIILLAVGAILLVRQFDFFFVPHWLFTWPMWLIGWGLFVGAKSNFHKPSSFVLVLLGVVFLIDENFHGASGVIWPMAFIIFGLWLILRRHSHFDSKMWENHYSRKWTSYVPEAPSPDGPATNFASSAIPPKNPSGYGPTGDDYLDAISVFGGVKKVILSKDFKGGEIVNVFGGAELDFTQADINGRVVIDITQIFGGTKIIVPPHWQVVSDLAAVFASMDDKRMKNTTTANSEKILIIKGVSIFAGVDVRSY